MSWDNWDDDRGPRRAKNLHIDRGLPSELVPNFKFGGPDASVIFTDAVWHSGQKAKTRYAGVYVIYNAALGGIVGGGTDAPVATRGEAEADALTLASVCSRKQVQHCSRSQLITHCFGGAWSPKADYWRPVFAAYQGCEVQVFQTFNHPVEALLKEWGVGNLRNPLGARFFAHLDIDSDFYKANWKLKREKFSTYKLIRDMRSMTNPFTQEG